MDNTTQQALDPYSWSQILNYYKNPNLTSENLYNVDESLRPIKFQPQYSYAQMRYMQNKGLNMPPPRYTVQEPTSPLSAYAASILDEYNRRAKKDASYITNDVLKSYLKSYNKANPQDKLVLSDLQSRIAEEFNASRMAQQADYNTQAAAYQANLARYNENPAAYYGSYTAKPTATSTNPYLQSLYTSAGVNQPPQQMANGGLVQDQFANYGTQLRNIPPLSMIRGGK